MVAPSRRIVASTLVAILVLGPFISLVPTAAATVAGTAALQLKVGGTYEAYPSGGRVLKANDEVRAVISLTLARCTGTIPSAASTVTATVDVAGKLNASNPAPVTLTPGTEDTETQEMTFTGNVDWKVVGNFASPAGVDALLQTIPLIFAVTCPQTAPTLPTVPPVVTSPAVNMDTRSPVIDYASAAWTNESYHIVVPGSTTAGLGTVVPFTPTATDGPAGGINTFLLNTNAITGASAAAITSGTVQSVTISPPVSPVPSLDGTSVNLVLTATDVNGNTATVNVPLSADNIAPAPTDFAISSALLTRKATGVTAAVGWSATAVQGGVTRALVNVRTADSPTFAQLAVATATQLTTTPAPISLTSNFDGWVDIELFPVDNGGNANLAERRATGFPANVTVEYGGVPSQPISVAGNAFRNVYLNASTNVSGLVVVGTESPAVSNANPPNLYGQLLRGYTGNMYWINGTSGLTTDLDTVGSGSSSLQGHYRLGPQLARNVMTAGAGTSDGTDTDGDPTTAFQPAVGGTVSGCLVGKLCFMFANLSGRSFQEGPYQLEVNLQNPTGGSRVKIVRDLFVDSTNPLVANHRNYTALGFGPNMSDVHGMDNNVVRVKFNVTDWQADPNGPRGSALRNVTMEIFDPETSGHPVVRRTSGSLARIDITPTTCTAVLPYCIQLPESSPGAPATNSNCDDPVAQGGTGGTTTGVPDIYGDTLAERSCAYRQIVEKGAWANATFVNRSHFSGWFNTTYPDLPAGRYKVRVLAYDYAGRETANVYGTSAGDIDHYRVAPVVRIDPDSDLQVNADGTLSVTPMASIRSLTPSASKCGTGGASAPTDVCPAQLVRLFVTNDPLAADGIAITPNLTDSAILRAPKSFMVNGVPTTLLENGTHAIALGSGPIYWDSSLVYWAFPYEFNGLPQLPATSTSFDRDQTVYVRAEAVVLGASGVELAKSTTPWTRTASALLPAFSVNEPVVEWSLNLSSQFSGPADPTGPTYNITFDRKTEPSAPDMEYKLYKYVAGAEQLIVTNVSHPAPLRVGLNEPRYVFNWSGNVAGTTGSPKLDAGEYHIAFEMHSGGALLASAHRNFTILSAAPTVTVDTGSLAVGVAKRGDRYYVGPSFEVPFTVTHGFANLTSVDQIDVKLVRGVVRAGETRELRSGDENFFVSIRPETPLDPSSTITRLTASITMPPGLINGDPFDLNITAKLDVRPYRLGNRTALLPLVHDKQPPSGAVQGPQTEATVVDLNTNNPRVNLLAPDPTFIGFAEDLGSGVAKVEVRIYDITGDFMLRRDVRVLGYQPNEWVAATDASDPFFRLAAEANGIRTWSYSARSIWQAGFIDFNHKFRIDVRSTDALGQVSAINTTTVSFDTVAPFLGYGGRLDSTSTTRSGITTSATTVDWHGSRVLSVSLTENHCVGAVRLVGVSDMRPNVTVKANMSPVTPGANGRVCYADSAAMPHSAGSGLSAHRYTKYSIDLANAPQMTDDISTYTYWFEAEDTAGNVADVPANFRLFRMQVLDNQPALVRSVYIDPSPGQAGGRALVTANVFDNLRVSHVTIQFRDLNSGALLASANMTAPEGVANGVGNWTADTTEDLDLTLETRDYLVNVTAYDINWNRSISPTCPAGFCFGSASIYRVRDDGAPTVQITSPADNSTVNATPTFTFRALNKNLATTDITVRAGPDGNLTAVPAANLGFVELKATNGTRQGWTVSYAPTGLVDATDHTVNVTVRASGLEAAQTYHFRVDTLAPTITANVTGEIALGGKTWAVAATRVSLVANDTVSTSPTIRYRVNGGASQVYSGPIAPLGDDGDWTLEYWATDAAQNEAARQTLTLDLDKTGPHIEVSQHGDNVLFTVTDAGVGLNESTVMVHYRYGEAISFVAKSADKDAASLFRAVLPGNATETGLAYYFAASDLLGNAGGSFSVDSPYVIAKAGENGTTIPPSDLPPSVQITAPVAGSSVRGILDIKWLAEDPEGAPLTITIALRDPPPGEVVSAGGENSGSFRLNVTGKPAGAYTIVVTASDGQNSATSQVLFNIESGETIKPRAIPPPTVQKNQPVSVAVSIDPTGKTVVGAQFRVLKDGALYRAGNLTQIAGAYAAQFTPNDAGAYRVLLDVGYSDGSRDTAKQIAAFSVPGGPDDGKTTKVFPGSLLALLALAGVTAALAAYGAFGRWRK